MSGIVGVFNLDGAPVDRRLLLQLTESLAFRGPDAQEIWADGPVGLGHVLLSTTHDSGFVRQPLSLDGWTWLTTDARIDAREELLDKLKVEGRNVSAEMTDAELILQSYQVWGEQCVGHLLGDFVFAIWDGCRQRLFCAHDHFGIKPFYYAYTGRSLLFSNTLNCLRLHPTVSTRLNELAIADFLLFDCNQEPGTTTFADIRRLPAAHVLTCSTEGPHIKRFWSLPVEGPTRYKRGSDYVEHFRELIVKAVADRLRTNQVGVFLSGGLDSSAVAATAKEVYSRQSVPFELRAHTLVYDRLIPDSERYYSGLVAESLGIPIHYLVADSYGLYERWSQAEVRTPEPWQSPLRAAQADLFRQAASLCRVVLTGEGGDSALQPSVYYFLSLAKRWRFDRLMWELAAFTVSHRQPPRVGLRTHLRRLAGYHLKYPYFPEWLDSSLESRLDLRGRWERFNEEPRPIHTERPEAYSILLSPRWQQLFERCDSGWTHFPVEVRHPFFDVRVLKYLLGLPAMPWTVNKLLLRETLRGIVPEQVRLRSKSPLARSPVVELLKRPEAQWIDHFEPAAPLARFVALNRVPPVNGCTDYQQVELNLRPATLNLWLQSLDSGCIK